MHPEAPGAAFRKRRSTDSGRLLPLRQGYRRGGGRNLCGTQTIRRVRVLWFGFKVVDIEAAARTARLSVTKRPGVRFTAAPETRLFGAEGANGGLIVIGGKVVDVPPGSPLSATIDETAQRLQEPGAIVPADGDGYLHRNVPQPQP